MPSRKPETVLPQTHLRPQLAEDEEEAVAKDLVDAGAARNEDEA